MYSTMQPCFGCLKEMVQANINRVVYLRKSGNNLIAIRKWTRKRRLSTRRSKQNFRLSKLREKDREASGQ